MNWNKLIRQAHRWLSIAFVAAVVLYITLMSQGPQPPYWVGLMALVPLVLLMLSGLYMFVLPYAQRWRGGRTVAGQE